MAPIVLWFATYAVLLRVLVPRLRARSKRTSEMKSLVVGRVVDGYTNILTLKLFARLDDEDRHVRDVFDSATRPRSATADAADVRPVHVAAGDERPDGRGRDVTLAVTAWQAGRVDVGTVAMAIPLTWQIASAAGWVAMQVTDIFENLGTIQEGMMTIARPIALQDRDGASGTSSWRTGTSASRRSASAMGARCR